MPVESNSRRQLLFGLAVVSGCALMAAHVLYLPKIVVDDAYISFRYARNLVSGLGLTFNPGERVEGYSNFLWVLLTAVGMGWRLDPIAWTRGLGAASLILTLILATHLARRATGSIAAAWGTAILLAASTALCGSAMGGLETGLYTMLVTASGVALAHRRAGVASALIGLAALTRPEGLGLCVVATALSLTIGGGDERRRVALTLIAPGLALFGALVGFRLAYFGEWLPNSVLAKSAMLPLLVESGPAKWPQVLFNSAGREYALDFLRYSFGVFVVFAVVPLLRPGRQRFVAGYLFGAVVMGLAVAIYNFGDWMSSFRLLTPYLPSLTVLDVWGMNESIAWARERGRAAAAGGLTIACVGVVAFCAAGQLQLRRPAVGPEPDRELAAVLDTSRQPGLLAATDVLGRLGYYAPGICVLDMAGLTDRHIARHGRPSPPFGRTDFAYVLSRRPQFIMNNVRTAWQRHLDRSEFSEGYWWVDRAVWTDPGGAGARPRYVFVRRGTVLEQEFRGIFRDAAFRSPRDIATGP